MKKFIHIRPYIVTITEKPGWAYAYDSDLQEFKTADEAWHHGLEALGHDDFWVAVMEKGKIIAYYSNGKKKINKKTIKEMNEEFALI